MKSKKRHQSSSEESEEDSDVSHQTSSSSESGVSSESDRRHKKKRKHRAESSESDSDSDAQRRSKKRKHKKKKRKHGKRKKRDDSEERDISVEEISISDGEVSRKRRKHKSKHSRRDRDSSAEEELVLSEEEESGRRLHSVVKEKQVSSGEAEPPARTYYPRERDYHRAGSNEDFNREREVQRFYRGSSRERSAKRPDHYDRHEKPQRYEERRPDEHHRPKEEYYRDGHKGNTGYHNNRYNQYEERGPKRYEQNDARGDYRDRRGPPPDMREYRQREYAERKERYEQYNGRPREMRRERPPPRADKPPEPTHREPESKSKSPEDRTRSRSHQRPKPEEGRYRDGRGDERDEERRPSYPDRPRREYNRPPRDQGDRPPPRERPSRFESEDNKDYSWGKTEVKTETKAGEKEKPDFGLSGKLTADANTVNGVVIKYTEPDDAKQPKRRWRFYPFKGDKALPILYIHRTSAFLIGRDKKVADIHLEHPSISKQHAALQYRATPFTRPDGTTGRRVRPYIIDLESANGTFVNNKKIEARRYVELLERDVVKFGFSAREYVLLHENSKDDAQDDDNQEVGIGAGVTTTEQIKKEKRAQQEVAEDGE